MDPTQVTRLHISDDGLPRQETVLQEFYSGGSVFVTGATGFMGKVLVEKLVRSCPGLDTVFMLVRSKKGKTVQERVDDLVNSPCFDRLRQERGPEFKARLVGVAGDISEEGLGLTEHDRHLLAERVTVVFHVAATVRFDEQLNVAVKQNVRATREVLALCRSCTRLKAVVHVSTAYANCPFSDIEERFYKTPLDCDKAIVMAETMPSEELKQQTPFLLGNWPNTYSFTKAIAEHVVHKHGQGLPIGVFRPAIVVCSASEPEPGWVDNYFGPGSIMAGVYAGYLRVIPGDESLRSVMVPCDMVINGIIASAWDISQKRSESCEVPVYNYTPSPTNSITWGSYANTHEHYMGKVPSSRAFYNSDVKFVANKTLLSVYRFLLHFLPAAIGDTALFLTGTKPFLIGLYKRAHKMMDAHHYFVTRQWNFQEKNLPEMWAKLEDRDKALFNFDMKTLDWDVFSKNTSPGLRKYLAKEDPSNIPASIIRQKRLKRVQNAFGTMLNSVALFVIVPNLFMGLKNALIGVVQLFPYMLQGLQNLFEVSKVGL